MPLVESVRRTTITTYNIEKSLSFYQDLLGMDIWYDGAFDDPVVREVYDLPEQTITRVCILKGSNDTDSIVSGMIGLMHFEELPSPDIAEPVKRPLPGEIVIMFGTTEMRKIEKRLKEASIAYTGPINLSTPGRKVVYELLTRDPNGVRIAFAQQSEID